MQTASHEGLRQPGPAVQRPLVRPHWGQQTMTGDNFCCYYQQVLLASNGWCSAACSAHQGPHEECSPIVRQH